jgi:Protein of unknown function (DUF726)
MIPREERISILNTLGWLCSRDQGIQDSEIDFLTAVANDLDLKEINVKNLVVDVSKKKINDLVSNIKTEEVKQNFIVLLLKLALNDGYDARERLGIFKIAKAMNIPPVQVEILERKFAEELKSSLSTSGVNQVSSSHDDQSDNFIWILLGGLAVGAACVVTGGLAAPAIGGLVGSSIFGLSGAAATSAGLAFLGGGSLAVGGGGMAAGTILISTIFGVAGSATAISKIARRVGDLEEFEPIYLNGTGLHTCLGISGFLTQDGSFRNNWKPALEKAFPNSSQHTLKWESKTLQDLGCTLLYLFSKPAIASIAANFAMRATSKAFGLLALPTAILSLLDILDNPWHVACHRSDKAGKALGCFLMKRGFGEQPVTLIGYSLGTRVILSALEYLSEHKAYGIVEQVYLLGGAVSVNDDRIKYLVEGSHKVVSGSVVNAYCSKDFILGYVYRTAELGAIPIGLSEIDQPGIININLDNIINGHLQYSEKLIQILQLIRAS